MAAPALPLIVDPQGNSWALGNVAPPGNRLMLAWAEYGQVPATPMFTRDQWDAQLRNVANTDPWLQYVHNQGQVGQCNADATTAAIEAQRAEQGLPFVQLSAADLYGQINGGVDQGSTLEAGMAAAMNTGVGSAQTVGALIWHPGLAPAPVAERRLYRVLDAYLCPTFDHCFSAVCAGFKLITGVPWFNSYVPDSSGWLRAPMPGEAPAGGHAIFGYAPTKNASGLYGIWHRNSWTVLFGVGGSFVLTEQNYRQGGAIGGWWAVRSVVDTGGGVPAPVA